MRRHLRKTILTLRIFSFILKHPVVIDKIYQNPKNKIPEFKLFVLFLFFFLLIFLFSFYFFILAHSRDFAESRVVKGKLTL